MTDYRAIAHNGLWKNNPGIVQLLGLCPLLAVTNSSVNAIGLGLATLVVLLASNITISLIRSKVAKEIRIPVFVLVIASFVTCIELLMNAYTYELYLNLGIFIPLIVTNCIIIGRAEAFAAKNPVSAAAFDGLMMGLGFGLVLLILGMLRELLGAGTLFASMDLLLGDWAAQLEVTVYQSEHNLLLAILPPGAFLVMGLLIALKNAIDQSLKKPKEDSVLIQPVPKHE